jgi:hypothetical protein
LGFLGEKERWKKDYRRYRAGVYGEECAFLIRQGAQKALLGSSPAHHVLHIIDMRSVLGISEALLLALKAVVDCCGMWI